MRLFVILLLLAVFFLSGTVFGMNQESSRVVEVTEEVEVMEEPVTPPVPETESIPVRQPAVDETSSNYGAQKTASVLEAGVKGFFELLMQIMYQIAQLFF